MSSHLGGLAGVGLNAAVKVWGAAGKGGDASGWIPVLASFQPEIEVWGPLWAGMV